jgi:hypothetical protein
MTYNETRNIFAAHAMAGQLAYKGVLTTSDYEYCFKRADEMMKHAWKDEEPCDAANKDIITSSEQLKKALEKQVCDSFTPSAINPEFCDTCYCKKDIHNPAYQAHYPTYHTETMDGILYQIIPVDKAKIGDECQYGNFKEWWNVNENVIEDVKSYINKIRRKVNV